MPNRVSKCWICGGNGNSGEHKIKKSDLKQQYSEISPQKPIFHRVNGIVKRPIRSFKSEAFKYPKSICAACNGTLTQPYDYAWGKLSKFLYTNSKKIQHNNVINLKDIYGLDFYENMKGVQLFFAKQFGCKIIESEFDFDLSRIRNAVCKNSEIPSFYLKLRRSDNGKSAKYSAVSDIEVNKSASGELKCIHFFYTIGAFSIDILYCADSKGVNLKNYFVPSGVGKQLNLGRANYIQEYVKS